MKDSANNNERKNCLPRSRILRGRKPIQRLFQEGMAVRERHMDLRYLLFPGQPGMCLMGFIAGKRIGKANERNVIKRRMREVYRQHQFLIDGPLQSGQTGFHGILIAKKAATPYRILEQECIHLLTIVKNNIMQQNEP